MICRTFANSDTVTVKPFYEKNISYKSISDMARTAVGTPSFDTTRKPTEPKVNEPKHVVVKVQVPHERAVGFEGRMLVYTKKATDLHCLVKRVENVDAYDRLYQVIKAKGIQGLKAYFSATIHSKDKLVIKISEVLAPQPF